MKKLTALLLFLALCLCACSNENNVTVDCDHEEYEELLELLEDGEFQAAHAYLYEMEGIDPESAEPTPGNSEEDEMTPEDTTPTVNTDGLLSFVEITTIDNLGNQDTSTEEFYSYDSYGRLYETDSVALQEYYGYEFGTFVPHFRFEYDSENVVSKITVMYHDDVEALLTPIYDDEGNLISVHIVTNTGEYDVNFTYDDNGNRLTGERYDSWYDTIETFVYSYSAEGLLEVKFHIDEVPFQYTITTIYTYDDAGYLVGSTETWENHSYNPVDPWNIFTVYTNDPAGKPISASITTDKEGSSYAEQIVTYHYGE